MRKRRFLLPLLCLVVVATILLQIEYPRFDFAHRPERVRQAHHPVPSGVEGPIEGLKIGRTRGTGVPGSANARVIESYGKLPLSFEANQGQIDSDVKFLSRGSGYSLFLTSNEAVLSLKPTKPSRDREGAVTQPRLPNETGPLAPARGSDRTTKEPAVLRMKLAGANPSPQVSGVEELPGKSNYFIGNDATKWRTNVPTYAKVRYENVYPGIDLVYYGNQRQLEYDFVVAPGADPSTIRLAFPVSNPTRDSNPSRDSDGAVPPRANQSPDRKGGVALRIDPQGDLLLDPNATDLRLHRPVIYQEINGARQRIAGNFVTNNLNEVGFEVARYDASKPLIIDPVLSYSTYLGGSSSEQGYGIAVDSSGNAYVTGETYSTNFPTANAFQPAYGGVNSEAFVTKLNATGSALVYSTYLGGSDQDMGRGIAVDSSGNAYVTGSTISTNFPTANAIQARYGGNSDAFVTKLNATGSALVYSTYLGGSDIDSGSGIAVDSSGNAYVTGGTTSTNFPKVNAFQSSYGGVGGGCCFGDAFVTKLNATGSALVFSTYLGGSGGDAGVGIAVDSSGNAYVTGSTTSTNFPTANAFQAVFGGGAPANGGDAFLAKINAAGSALVYSTYLGGSDVDGPNGIAVDSSGNAYVTGLTLSNNFPTANALQLGGGSAFVTKLNAAGSALVYSTHLGGSGILDQGAGIAVDSSGNAYVTGITFYSNFPTVNAFQATYGGNGDVFLIKLDPAGSSLAYSTYLGGSGADYSYGIAVDSSGNAYVTGFTQSNNFPTANAFQPALNGSADAFVTKFPSVTTGALPPPQLTQGGVVNGASFTPGGALVPGSIASVFGNNLSSGSSVTIQVNGVSAPVFAYTQQQINFQVPWELAGLPQASLTATVGGVISNAVTVNLTPLGPGLFSTNSSGTGQGAILIANTASLAAPVGAFSGSAPVQRGGFISIYCTGLGAVSNQPGTGVIASANPLSVTTTTPTVAVGGVPALVSFSGLASGFFGLYQVNVQIPAGAPTGNAVPVVLTIGGVASNPVTIAITAQ